MAKNNDYDYFETFVRMVNFSCDAAKILRGSLTDFKVEGIADKLDEMHAIEHAADLDKHEMMRKLAKEFLPPIEREDIMSLASELDDVTDTIEDVLIRLYMFNITTIRVEALDFCNIVIKCCDALKKLVEEFHNFRKSKTIHEYIVEINHLEEEGDKIYTDAVRRLYYENNEPMEILKWRETFDRFEKCCDACEDVADVIESVIMKNS